MKILLVYATNSGSTLEVSNAISGELTPKGNEVVVKDATEVQPDDFGGYDLIILGSPTYDDGKMHELFHKLGEKFVGKTFEGKKFAVFGLGDESYPHFCGAVEELAEFVKKLNGTLSGEPLKINNYYFNQQEEAQKITDWTQKLQG